MKLGARIRKLRKRQGKTLENVANACGFTRSLLSKIENNRTSPPVATLTKIAGALGVSVAGLIEDGNSAKVVFDKTVKKKKGAVAADSGYTYDLLAAARAEKLMQPYIFYVKKGKVKSHALNHTGEEFIHVLEGQIRYRVGAVEHRMGPGDSLYFDAEEDHEVIPVSYSARYLAIFSDGKKL